MKAPISCSVALHISKCRGLQNEQVSSVGKVVIIRRPENKVSIDSTRLCVGRVATVLRFQPFLSKAYENDQLWSESKCARGPPARGWVTSLSHYWETVEF